MSVDSENKSNEAIASYTSSTVEPKNAVSDGDVTDGPVTPEMVLRLPTITDSTTDLFPFRLNTSYLHLRKSLVHE